MKIVILGAQRRLRGMCGENQPEEDSRLDRECPIFERTRISRHKKTTALDRSEQRAAAATESQKAKSDERKAALYIFSVLPSYFTAPFLSFWRVTSSLV